MEIKCPESSNCSLGHAFKPNTCGVEEDLWPCINCPRMTGSMEELITLLEAGGRDKGGN